MTGIGQEHNLAQAQELADRLSKMSPMERTLAANDPANGSYAVRIIAMTLVRTPVKFVKGGQS